MGYVVLSEAQGSHIMNITISALDEDTSSHEISNCTVVMYIMNFLINLKFMTVVVHKIFTVVMIISAPALADGHNVVHSTQRDGFSSPVLHGRVDHAVGIAERHSAEGFATNTQASKASSDYSPLVRGPPQRSTGPYPEASVSPTPHLSITAS